MSRDIISHMTIGVSEKFTMGNPSTPCCYLALLVRYQHSIRGGYCNVGFFLPKMNIQIARSRSSKLNRKNGDSIFPLPRYGKNRYDMVKN